MGRNLVELQNSSELQRPTYASLEDLSTSAFTARQSQRVQACTSEPGQRKPIHTILCSEM